MDNSNNKNNGFYWALGLGAAVVFLVFLVNVVNVRFGVPYKKHGPLSVKEDHLVDSEERPVQLKGVCIPGIAWYPQYINKASFRTLRDEWGVDVIRLAVYTQEYDGYLNGADITQIDSIIDHGVRYCTDLGLYCIIDWHTLSDYDPNMYKSEAVKFFDKMSEKYGKQGNVIFEICNEPSHGTNWTQIKSYAETILPVIRENAPKSIVLIGTPRWCQNIDSAAMDPLTGQENIMYTCHFYAATHKDKERAKLNRALNLGCPVFVSEYGICEADGGGEVDKQSAEIWKHLLDNHNLSYCAWGLCNKDQTFAFLKHDVKKVSGWKKNDLTESGIWVRRTIRGTIF